MTITARQFENLLTRCGACIIDTDRNCKLIYCLSEKEFQMHGPNGVHKLFAPATDRKRLNAHWEVFSSQ